MRKALIIGITGQDGSYLGIFTFQVKIMVDSDLTLMGLEPPGEGKTILEQKGINWTENHLTVW